MTVLAGQRESGIYSLLGRANLYNWLQSFVGGRKARQGFVDRYVRPKEGDVVLDVGCGTGNMVEFLPENVRYVGIDVSADYIASAKERWGTRGQFIVGSAADLRIMEVPAPDIVILVGVLHHLDDPTARGVFSDIAKIIVPGGRFVSLDSVYVTGQNPIARAIISRDRGRNVRTEQDYASLARPFFPRPKTMITHDLLNIPYTHIIMEGISDGG